MIKNHVQTQSYYLAVAEPVIKPEACIYLPYRYGSYGRTGNQRPKFVCFPPYNYGSPNALCDWLVNSLNCDVQLILQEHSGLGVSTFQYPCFHTGRFNQPQWCTIAEYIYWKKLKYKWTHTFCSRVNCIIYIYIYIYIFFFFFTLQYCIDFAIFVGTCNYIWAIPNISMENWINLSVYLLVWTWVTSASQGYFHSSWQNTHCMFAEGVIWSCESQKLNCKIRCQKEINTS